MSPVTDRVVRRGAASVAIAAVLIVIVTTVTVLNPGARDWVRMRMGWMPRGFVAGAASGLPAALHDDARVTALIFVTTGCDACARAQAFHRDIAALPSVTPGLRVRLLMTSDTDDPARYAAALQIPVEAVRRFDPRGSLLRRVPTVLVVDRDGIVREMKEGVLSLSEQHALVETITRLAGPMG